MKNWFTVEQIDPDTYAISEYGHWEETHSYLICGAEQALLIDTGLGVAPIREIVDSLTQLPIIVATTHVHWDHIGGHASFDRIWAHEAEKDWLSVRFPLPLQAVLHNLTCKPCKFPDSFDIGTYSIYQGEPSRLLCDGDCIDLGGREISVIHTPGHSPGHCCFYEPQGGFLFSGDLVYRGCLDAFYPTTDPLQFWKSVKKIKCLEVSRVLPGHHQLDIQVQLIDRVDAAFGRLAEEGNLTQGSGMFEFGDFQIHI